MIRKIIQIDEERCNGCGACAAACHEGAIGMADGKAKLLRDDYCDGLGDCLPACPTDAISFVEREAAAYDHEAVMRKKMETEKKTQVGCPGARAAVISGSAGCLSQWPVQMKLVPVKAPYFDGAKLLIAADCTAFACAEFHERFIRDHITLVGCPKLDAVDYSEKLTEIIRENEIQSVTVVRMEVPCCGGIEYAVKAALQNSRKVIPWSVIVITTDGKVMREL